MEQIRARVDAIVEDPKTAAALKPYYPYGCKRPTFHDEYLPTFNLPHVHLVDTAPMGVARDQRARRRARRCRVPARRADLRDRLPVDGDVDVQHDRRAATAASLSEKWQTEGTKTFLGLHSHGLPEPVHRHRPAGRRRQLQLHRRDRHPRRLRRVDADRRCASAGHDVVDVTTEAGGRRTPSTAARPTSPPRRCATASRTTTATAKRRPGSLAYYGGAGWKRRCQEAQETLAPYVFQA